MCTVQQESGILRKEDLPGPQNPLSDPTKALEPLKNQMGSQIGFVATNAIMMGFSGHFFGGFILVHLPFLLTNRFKVMLQSGIDLATLDPSYVSSVSWYFLVMFGLRSFLNLIFVSGVAAEEDERMMQVGVARLKHVIWPIDWTTCVILRVTLCFSFFS